MIPHPPSSTLTGTLVTLTTLFRSKQAGPAQKCCCPLRHGAGQIDYRLPAAGAAGGRAEIAARCKLLEQPLIGLGPEFRHIGELLAVDDDKQVEVREVASDRVLDPVAARVAAEQGDLEQPVTAQVRPRPAGDSERGSLRSETGRVGKKGERK